MFPHHRSLGRPAIASVAALSIALLSACGSATSSSESNADEGSTHQFVVSGISPPDNPNSVALQEYLDVLSEQSDGRLDFETHWSGELIPTPEALDGLGQGTIDILLSQASYYVSSVPIGGWADVPVYPESYEQSLETFHKTEIHEIVDEAYADVNAKVLQLRILNPYVFIMAEGQEVRTVEDFAGKKIRAAGGPQSQILEALDAVPVELEAGDFFTAFQQKVVDGFILPLYALESYKLGELAGSVTLPGIGVTTANHLWMNLDRWNELPEDLREVIETSAIEDIPRQAEFWTAEEEEELDYVKSSGVEVIEMAPDEIARMKELTQEPVAETFIADTGDQGQRILEILNQAS